MFIKRHASNIGWTSYLSINIYRPAIYTLIVSSTLLIGLTGCGQKGELYLTDSGSKTIVSSQVLDSTSNPQDAAFGNVDDDNYQNNRYLEQKQVLPDVSNDPNDY